MNNSHPIRTDNQHRALFKYLGELAQALNEAGVDQKLFIEHLKGWEVPITKEFLHQIWKMKQEKMGMGDSTTKLHTDQVTQVYDAINLFTGTHFGVSEAFPSEEELNRICATKQSS